MEAHRGAVLAARWSYTGTDLLTGTWTSPHFCVMSFYTMAVLVQVTLTFITVADEIQLATVVHLR